MRQNLERASFFRDLFLCCAAAHALTIANTQIKREVTEFGTNVEQQRARITAKGRKQEKKRCGEQTGTGQTKTRRDFDKFPNTFPFSRVWQFFVTCSATIKIRTVATDDLSHSLSFSLSFLFSRSFRLLAGTLLTAAMLTKCSERKGVNKTETSARNEKTRRNHAVCRIPCAEQRARRSRRRGMSMNNADTHRDQYNPPAFTHMIINNRNRQNIHNMTRMISQTSFRT